MKPYIVAVRSDLLLDQKTSDMIECGNIGCRFFESYRILKMRHRRKSSDTVEPIAVYDLQYKTIMYADIVYDTETKKFHKNRYGTNDDTMECLPPTLQRVMKPVFHILNGMKMDYLSKHYTRSQIVDAVFLTDSYGSFGDDIEELEYQLTRFRFGKPTSKSIRARLVEKYPEKLI